MFKKFIKFISRHYAVFTGVSAGAAFAVLVGFICEANLGFDIIPWSILIALLVTALCLEAAYEEDDTP